MSTIAKFPSKALSPNRRSSGVPNKCNYIFIIEAKKKPESKWILLQDWSQCTLACGGGKSYRHRFCVQPTGANACIGTSIEEKPCNSQPCNIIEDVINSDKKTQLAPIVVLMRISNKPAKFNVNSINIFRNAKQKKKIWTYYEMIYL